MENTKTLCVILHYGNESVTWDCVNSVAAYDFLDILVVDNDPAQKVEIPQRFVDKVNLVRTGGGAGFATANNMAVRIGRKATHRSVLLLNNDTIVLDDALLRLRVLLDTEEIGAVGPCMPFASHPDRIWACGGVINKFRVTIHGQLEIVKPEPYEVDYLPGAAILCKLSVWDLVGGLPEKYFMAYEEAEFALRIRKIKYRIMVHPKARILHNVGMSSDNQPMYIYNRIRNRLRFGMFLWGNLPGFIWASIWSLIGVRHYGYALAVWSRAVSDEMRGIALDRSVLQEIKHSFGG
jgi:GT2 family glycosyltransferase